MVSKERLKRAIGKKRFIRFYQNLPIRSKFMLVLVLMIIIPLVGLSAINYKNSEESLRKKSIQYSQDILKLIEIRLLDYVSNLNLISLDLLPDRKALFTMNDYATPPDPLQIYEEAYVIENVLKKVIFTRQEEIQSIALISSRGNYHPADDNSRVIKIKDMVPFSGPLYNAMLEQSRGYSGSPSFFFDTENGRVKNFFLVRTIYDVDNFEEIGLMVILLKKEFINTVFKELVNEDIENILVLSSSNEIIVDRDSQYSVELGDLMENLEGWQGWYADPKGQTIVTYQMMKEEPGWKILSFISLKSLYRDIDRLRESIIVTSIIIVIVLLIVSALMTYDFSHPFKKLLEGMARVQKGDKEVRIELTRQDEFGQLGEAFNRMVEEMNLLTDFVYREQITRREAEIKALQAQINPHFLFNTLESINWMAHLNHVPEISETVTALSSLMEAGIGRDDKLITLAQELEYIDNYYLILKKRFEDRIQLEKRVEDEALDVKIPRLLIQPLIENAIYHGIENEGGRGVVTITAGLCEGRVLIVVEDNGEGIEEDKLKAINERLNNHSWSSLEYKEDKTFHRSSRGSNSIGLENVNRRIKLFYGSEYGLHIESVRHCYTRVYMIIPIKTAEYLEEKVNYVQGLNH